MASLISSFGFSSHGSSKLFHTEIALEIVGRYMPSDEFRPHLPHMSFQRPKDRTYRGGSPQQFDATEAEPGAPGNSRPPWASSRVIGGLFIGFPFCRFAQAAVPELGRSLQNRHSMENYYPEVQYSLEEYKDDWETYARAAADAPNTAYTPKNHFLKKYPDRKGATFRFRRFGKSLLYLKNNFHALGFSPSSQGHLIPSHLLIAIWRYYGPIPDEHIDDEPPVESILAMAEEEMTRDN